MSDHIEIDGRKYFEESYLLLANDNAVRHSEAIRNLNAEVVGNHSRIDELTANLGDALDTNRALTAEVARLEGERAEIQALQCELARLRNMIGDNACHLTQAPDAVADLGIQLPPWPEFGESCRRFHAQVTEKTGTLTGCMTIAQLEGEVARLESELKEWQDYWGCESPHDSHVQAGSSERFSRQLGKEQARANLAENMLRVAEEALARASGLLHRCWVIEAMSDIDSALAKIREATVAKDATVQPGFSHVWRCSSCGDMNSTTDPRWRWNGNSWEHKCGDPQAGYFPARCFGQTVQPESADDPKVKP